jgi:hypothetical protein
VSDKNGEGWKTRKRVKPVYSGIRNVAEIATKAIVTGKLGCVLRDINDMQKGCSQYTTIPLSSELTE